jgi:hypothetical protein
MQSNEGKFPLLVTYFTGTAFYSAFLKGRCKGQEDKEEGLSTNWMTLSEEKILESERLGNA